jgi:hypothetical protein
MKDIKFSDYTFELVNYYKVLGGMTGDQARRYVLDIVDDVLESYNGGYSAHSIFSDDVNNNWAGE